MGLVVVEHPISQDGTRAFQYLLLRQRSQRLLPQVLAEKCGNLRVLEVLFESCTCWLSHRLLIISLQGLGLGHLGAPIDLFVMSFGLFDPVFDLFFLESKCRQLLFALEDCKLNRLLILCWLVDLIAVRLGDWQPAV